MKKEIEDLKTKFKEIVSDANSIKNSATDNAIVGYVRYTFEKEIAQLEGFKSSIDKIDFDITMREREAIKIVMKVFQPENETPITIEQEEVF